MAKHRGLEQRKNKANQSQIRAGAFTNGVEKGKNHWEHFLIRWTKQKSLILSSIQSGRNGRYLLESRRFFMM
jgi:hypothetical protein